MSQRICTESVINVMNKPENIRNISVIAHVDHGKSTLTDSLVHAAGLMKQESVGNRRFTDTMKQEMERGVTIKSTSITLIHKGNDGKEYLVNVIDSPGHIDFSSEVTAALRCTDGGIIVIDSVEGVASQTRTVIKQALQERVMPCLMINKIDRMITELGTTPSELYLKFEELVATTNMLIEKFRGSEMGDMTLDPVKGNVCFGSGKHGFAFSIPTFATILSQLIPNLNKEYFRKRLWGNYYYDPSNDKIVKSRKSPVTGELLKRTFVVFILQPLYDIYALFEQEFEEEKKKKRSIKKIKKFIKRYNITLKREEIDLISSNPKKVRNMVLSRLAPAAPALLEMIIDHLPSPVKAQVYRSDMLYTGPPDDPISESIRKCDPNGPLVLYTTKVVEIRNEKICFGRIFSGSVRNSQKVYIISDDDNNNNDNKKNNRKNKKRRAIPGTIQNVYVMLAKSKLSIPFSVCGSVCGVTGLDEYILKTATITDHPEPSQVYPIKSMSFSVRPVVQIGIRPKKPQQLKTLLSGVRRMVKTDPILQLRVDQSTNQLLLQGSGEFHLALTLEVLREEICKNVEIITSPMIVTFRESVSIASEPCLSKSKNKLNRVFVQVEPLSNELVSDLVSGRVGPTDLSLLRTVHGWNKDEVKKIWAFGPAPENTCILVNCSRSVMYLNEVRESIVSGFQWACQESVLSKEPLRGVRINILDGMFHQDNSHRGTGQILPCARRAIFGALLNAQPALVEPWYKIEVNTSQNSSGTVYGVLKRRRGMISNIVNSDVVSDGVVIHANLPVLESFGLVKELRTATSGDALTSMQFDHYESLNGDVFDEESKVHNLVMEIRKRKKMKLELPGEKDYRDIL